MKYQDSTASTVMFQEVLPTIRLTFRCAGNMKGDGAEFRVKLVLSRSPASDLLQLDRGIAETGSGTNDWGLRTEPASAQDLSPQRRSTML